MTPADIQNKRFDKGMGGYKTEEVHQFLTQVADHVAGLEDERADLLEKMEVLAEKLEQYREDEESLRAALIGAQKLGNSVVRESQRKAEAIIAQAVRKAEDMVNDAQKNIDSEALALKRMQRDVAGFRERIIRLYSEHLEMIKRLPDTDMLPDVELTQISYIPPSAKEVKEELNLPITDEDEHPVPAAELLPSEQELEYAMANGTAEDNSLEGEDGENAKSALNNKKNLEQLNQFFGEDKPIERK